MTTFKTTKMCSGSLKVWNWLFQTTRCVYDYGTLLDVDKANRWCNRWRSTTKDTN